MLNNERVKIKVRQDINCVFAALFRRTSKLFSFDNKEMTQFRALMYEINCKKCQIQKVCSIFLRKELGHTIINVPLGKSIMNLDDFSNEDLRKVKAKANQILQERGTITF